MANISRSSATSKHVISLSLLISGQTLLFIEPFTKTSQAGLSWLSVLFHSFCIHTHARTHTHTHTGWLFWIHVWVRTSPVQLHVCVSEVCLNKLGVGWQAEFLIEYWHIPEKWLHFSFKNSRNFYKTCNYVCINFEARFLQIKSNFRDLNPYRIHFCQFYT